MCYLFILFFVPFVLNSRRKDWLTLCRVDVIGVKFEFHNWMGFFELPVLLFIHQRAKDFSRRQFEVLK